MSIRDLNKLPLVALMALAAACSGGNEQAAPATTDSSTPAPSGTPTVEMPANNTVTPTAGATATPDAGGQVHEVKMVTTQGGAAGEFQPKTITVKKGDVIRWTMAESGIPHNVSFAQGDNNPAGFTPPADSPLYTNAGETYELKIDMAPGTYNYACVPHKMMGMVGSITVTE